jgi:hypothetical protein
MVEGPEGVNGGMGVPEKGALQCGLVVVSQCVLTHRAMHEGAGEAPEGDCSARRLLRGESS